MKEFKVENIVILAGGKSRRFWPLKEKLFYKFLGKELVLHQLDKFKSLGKRIFLVVREEIKDKLKFITSKGVELVVQPEALRGQAGALKAVLGKIKGELLVVNANDVFEKEDLLGFLQDVRKLKPEGQLAFFKVKDYFPGGYLRFAGKRVVEIVEKPGKGKEPSDSVRAVLDYFKEPDELKDALEKVKKFHFDEQYEQAINLLLCKKNFFAYKLKHVFLSLKYPWHVLLISKHFLKKIDNSRTEKAIIGKHSIIEGSVVLEEGVKIGSFCKLKGPLYIGKNSAVGDYSLIRESHIGESCVIGAHSEVARSYLSDNVWLHRNYVGDSILGSSAMLGAGSIAANFRLDGKEISSKIGEKKIETGLLKLGAVLGEKVKIGSGVILLPGVKIGRKSFIGPGEVVKEDVEEGSFVFQGKIVKNREVKK